MTHLDDAHAALMRAVASEARGAIAFLSRAQAGALLDEAARLVAERDALKRERDEWKATAEAAQNTGLLNVLRAEAVAERNAALAALSEVRAERDDLRAALRPLLTDPFRAWEKGWVVCPFCLAQHADEWNFPHGPDCPVRSAGRLLGDEEG